jgi:hypothetical protein
MNVSLTLQLEAEFQTLRRTQQEEADQKLFEMKQQAEEAQHQKLQRQRTEHEQHQHQQVTMLHDRMDADTKALMTQLASEHKLLLERGELQLMEVLFLVTFQILLSRATGVGFQ